jgi:GNAT superfamily N-acetyltransferase
MDGIRYRSATPRDAYVIAELIAAGFATYTEFAPTGWQPRPAGLEEPEVHVRLGRGDVHGRLALSDGGVAAGFAAWMPAAARGAPAAEPIPGRGHIWSLFVARDWWGSGLAPELLDWLVAGMRDCGLDSAQLWTPRDHARARRFYEREGWRGGRTEFSPELKLDLVLYQRELP